MFTDSPVILAPMAGGIGTPELVAEVSNAGGFGFLPAGYLTVDTLAEQWQKTTALSGKPFGVNVFVPEAERNDGLDEYVAKLGLESVRLGVELGEPKYDDDEYFGKMELLIALRVPVVSFTFGLPLAEHVDRLHAAGSTIVVTVTTVEEGIAAMKIGADVLCAQGYEAGGHRASFKPDERFRYGILPLLGGLTESVDLPLIASGGLMRAADVAAVRAGGAVAAQCGTAFLRCPEAGTKRPHREALANWTRQTSLTRTYTGKHARGLFTGFMHKFEASAPNAYPQVHHLTAPLRAAAAAINDQETMSLWAGQGYRLARAEPAADVLRRLTP